MNRPKKSLYERIADSYGNYTVERGLVSKEEGPIQAYGMLVVLCNGTTYLLILLLSFILHCVARTVLFYCYFRLLEFSQAVIMNQLRYAVPYCPLRYGCWQ